MKINLKDSNEHLTVQRQGLDIINLDEMVVKTTYLQLKSLRDGGNLVAGAWYRITDYVTTTAQEDTQAANHQFDIIVVADDESHLNENAHAARHSGDTYFANSKLESWQLKYCIDNDTTRFAWADNTNGKGVIYYMKDEWNNECGYDFKNIQMKFYKITAVTTVPSDLNNTYSISKRVGTTTNSITSGCTVDETDYEWRYTFDLFIDNTHNDYSLNKYGTNGPKLCINNKIPMLFGDSTTFGDNAASKLQNINFISFRNTAVSNECSYNLFGDRCYNVSFGSEANHNVFGGYCYLNTFSNSCYFNTFGNYCHDNINGEGCMLNVLGQYCYNNIFGTYSYCNTFNNYCEGNTLGNYCQSMIFEQECYSITISDHNLGHKFCNGCNHINISKQYSYSITIEPNNFYITITSTQTTSSTNKLRCITVLKGVNTSSTMKTISHDTLNDTFQTTYQPANSQTITIN